MTDSSKRKRIFLLGNPNKPETAEVMKKFSSFAIDRCELVGAQLTLDGRAALDAGADMLIVFGGDGTMLSVARSLGENQIPLVGVNMGKLGYLADYLLEELQFQFDNVLNDPSLASHRMILDVTVIRNEKVFFQSIAINDCAIQAGPPFRMIGLTVLLNGKRLTDILGDGLIISTPNGSTAYNLAAGGPIVQPGVHALVLTPLNVHSLTHRPMVIEFDSHVEVQAAQLNHGSALIVDGQVSCDIREGDKISVQRSQNTFNLVHNPMYPRWHKLVDKLGWGQTINY